MVDTIDVTQAQYFIPEIWAQEALEILRSNIVLTPRVYSDSDVASFSVGDISTIPPALSVIGPKASIATIIPVRESMAAAATATP